MITHKTAPATMTAVRISRALVGASSRLSQPSQSESIGSEPDWRNASRNVALMELFPRRTFDDRDRGRAHAEKIRVGIFDFDANRKALRDAHPVEFAFDVRNSRWRQIDLALRLNRPTNSLHFSTEALVRRGRKVNDRFAARSHALNFGFAKICDHVPFARVEQREDGNPGGNMGAGRNVEIDDASGKRRDDLAVGEMEFIEIDGRQRTFALSLQGRLFSSGFIDVFGGRKAIGQQRFEALQGAVGLCKLSIQSGQISFGLFQNESVILRVDFEKHVAFLHRLVILHIQLKDLTSHTWRNAYHIGARGRIIGPRMTFDDCPDVECDDHRAGDDDQTYTLANELVMLDVDLR